MLAPMMVMHHTLVKGVMGWAARGVMDGVDWGLDTVAEVTGVGLGEGAREMEEGLEVEVMEGGWVRGEEMVRGEVVEKEVVWGLEVWEDLEEGMAKEGGAVGKRDHMSAHETFLHVCSNQAKSATTASGSE